MNDPDQELRRKILTAAFRMPSVQTMVSRKSSITNAFVNAVIPVVEPTIEEIDEALRILGMTPEDVRCAYCGDKASEWDHLRPLVVKQRPTGFISEIANLVPACGKCNQSKGNHPWRKWILSEKAKHSPTKRKIVTTAERIARLERYEQWRQPLQVDFRTILGEDEWDGYWKLWDGVNGELRRCQDVANLLRRKVADALKAKA
jgi:5-methylcytosine-specific restriction endonuclease McrA